MNLHYRISALTMATLGALTLSACQTDGEEPGQDFISDDPTAGTWGDDGDPAGEDGAGTTGGDEGGNDGGEEGGDSVDISEADIIQMEGDRLYALSTYSGLTVVDMSNPDDLRALGTWETEAEPFEMYVDGGQAFVMFNDFYFWEYDEELDEWLNASTSRLVALDASNPANIEVRGDFELPGRIQDSRRVGDVLYLVTLEDGWCWGCDGEQKTVLTSLDISDPANPAVVEQLEFVADNDNWDWQRSVESTVDRMYVASRTWAWEGMGSLINVVDISAHDGSLVLGDEVSVTGSVFSRWQMDEYQGVLRVISQLGWEDDPVIETFTIESSDSIVPLGTGSLSIPMPESLRSARFDGDRAYAITAEQTDPLFTIDLSDPAAPTQEGELEIPGWVYHLEPRGDRVLALGFDPGNPEGGANVSLFDVSVFDQPTLRKRVHFGGEWASFAEDQNRIHKAFTILEDEEMILVPHSGWDWSGGFECSGDYRSGVQIIDWMDDDLFLRGLVPSRGRARRAFTHKDRIVTVSDMQLATFEYSDRDNPAPADQLALAVQVDDLVGAGNLWVRLARDWYTNSQILEVVDGADPGAAEPLGVIDLGEAGDCEWPYVAGLYAVGDHVFVVQSVWSETWDNDNYTSNSLIRVLSVDLSDPSAPTLDDSYELEGEQAWGVGQLAGVDTGSSWIAQQGQHLALLMRDVDADYEDARVEVIDLSDPENLAPAATLERPAGEAQGQLSVLSDTIVSWHTEPVEGQPGKVRFYFDRLDLDGTPAWATKVNVPGIIVAYDADAGRAFTVDFDLEQANLGEEACYANPKFWEWDGQDCTLIHRSLEHLSVSGSGATLIESVDIEGEDGLQQLRAGEGRIFAKVGRYSWGIGVDDGYDYQEQSRLLVVDSSAEAASVAELDGETFGDWWSIRAVEGARAVISAGWGQLGLVDASDPQSPAVDVSSLPGYGGCYNPVLDGDTVYCPMGARGLETVEW